MKRYPAPTRRGAEVEARLDLVAEIYGLTGGEKVRRIGALAERFEIGRFMEQRARSL